MRFLPKCRLGLPLALTILPIGAVALAAPFEHDEFSEAEIRSALATHWAYQPPKRHEPPAIPRGLGDDRAELWNRSRIDRFVADGIVSAGLTPASRAEPRHLVRRLFYDLTGLPPSAEEADAFCLEPSEAAYVALVERLLASREHAEHQARKWLDLARYADTVGYAIDGQASAYPFAWTYRDWVVTALHNDLPYDRFVTLQLAADLVEPPVPPADLAALGFLTVGRTFTGNEHDIIDDRIDLVTRGLMGLSVACARCHDHKYEFVTTADYYALHGIFASCEMPEELPVIGPPPPGPDSQTFAVAMAKLESHAAAHESAVYDRATRQAIAHAGDYFSETARPRPRPDGRPPQLEDGYELEQLLIDRLARKLDKVSIDDPVLGLWVRVRALSDEACAKAVEAMLTTNPPGINETLFEDLSARRPTTPAGVAKVYERVIGRAVAAATTGEDSPDLMAFREALTVPGAPLVVLPSEFLRVATRAEKTEMRKRQRAIIDHQATASGGPPRAMTLVDKARPRDSRILHRGIPSQAGDVVARRMPTVLGGQAVNPETSGRLELARMITSPANPLVARLLVDGVWRHHFGRGFLETPGDLGLRGDAPSHPELLDDLAWRFMHDGKWSLRWLHREIVMSETWRQASTIRSDTTEKDPDNRLFARSQRRRLDWEAWRDSLLVAAGSLDTRHPGGPGIDPLAVESFSVRSLYGHLDRQDVPGIMRAFDIASPDTAVHARRRTTVPQQALASLNAPLVVEAARRLAARVAVTDERAFVKCVWRHALARDPSDDEVEVAVAWLAAEGKAGGTDHGQAFGPRARLAQAVLATAEFEFVD